VALLPAAISRRFGPSECAGARPLPAKINSVALDGRLNANSITSAISTLLFIGHDRRVAKPADVNNRWRAGPMTEGDTHSFCIVGA
jgi:hypothetical protein